MAELSQQSCEVCHANAPTVTTDELRKWLPHIPEWRVEVVESVMHLVREFSFNNYVDALAFTNHVAALAESENHHPAILLEWGKVRVSWWTHKVNGLHKNDLICAAKTDKAFH